MERKLLNRLMLIAIGGLIFAGILFICLCIASETKNNTELFLALGCGLLANLFNIVRCILLETGDKR